MINLYTNDLKLLYKMVNAYMNCPKLLSYLNLYVPQCQTIDVQKMFSISFKKTNYTLSWRIIEPWN